MEQNREKFKYSEYTNVKIIGTGSFGKVKLIKHRKEKTYSALKILKKETIIELKQIDHIYSEYILLSEIKHPFIVNLMNFAQDDKFLYLQLEYIPGGELFTLLRQAVSFPVEQARFYAAQVVCVFDYLHCKNIVYRDLKPENVLISTNGYLKLTDFGFAKKLFDTKTYTLCGTPEYLAPEIIMNKGHSTPVDWWTLGILLYEMLVGLDPFNDDDPMMIYQKVLGGKFKFPKDFDKNARSLIKRLLVADSSKRLGCMRNGAHDIYNHKFFKNFDWVSLLKMTLPAQFIPKIRNLEDTSNFSDYPDSDSEVASIGPEYDPFLNW